MPFISAVSTIDFPDKVPQHQVRQAVLDLFSEHFPQAERLSVAFENTGIQTRNFCKPLSFYRQPTSFGERNQEYVAIALDYSVQAVADVLKKAGVTLEEVTDLVVVSTTGLATPGLDALIINKMRLNPHVNRLPVWGLGCAGGVAGVARAMSMAKADPKAVVVVVAVELCSLTLIRDDYSKSNFIGSSLFSDGVAALVIKGDEHHDRPAARFIGSSSTLYYDSLEVMGWDFQDSGFKVRFSKDIPTIIHQHIRAGVDEFLARHGLTLTDIAHFIFHPGGKKVLDAYAAALDLPPERFSESAAIMAEYGNMSSTSVLYVLERFLSGKCLPGYGLMLAMGPGFSSEWALLEIT